MIRNVLSNLIVFLLLIYCFIGSVFAKTYKIGDTIEVIGTIIEVYPAHLGIETTCIEVELPAQVKLEFETLPERNRCSEADKETHSYNIGYNGSIYTLDSHNEEMQKWREKIGIDRFIRGKKVKMQAKIGLCDECKRLCERCNVCCIIYLEPIKIEILTIEETPLQNKQDLIERFDFDQKLLSDTGFVKDDVRIYYLEPKTRNLYSINADGSENKKVRDGFDVRSFGWSHSGDKMFVKTATELIIMNPDGTHQEIIFTTQLTSSYISNVQWSPDARFISFGVNENGRGKTYYTVNLNTKERIKFFQEQRGNYPKDSVEAVLWNKEAEKIYIFNTQFSSANDFADQVFEYDISAGSLNKIREGKERNHGDSYSYIYIESLKDSISFTRKHFSGGLVTIELEEENGIKIDCLTKEGVILERTLQRDNLNYVEKYRLDNPYSSFGSEVTNFFWLTSKRYIIFQYYGICILDPFEMKAGRLVEGYDFGWFEKNSSYEMWKKRWSFVD